MASTLPLVPQFIENTLKRWADKRQTSSGSLITTNYKNLYILPTRNAFSFFIILLFILFGAINYENSLAYMLTFLAGSIGLLAMIYTHQNLNHLQIRTGRAAPVFAGQTIHLPFYISNQDTLQYKINIHLQSEKEEASSFNLEGNNTSEVLVPVKSTHRGYLKIRRIKIFTEYPLGLFHAWSWLKPDTQCLVYPTPETHHYPLLNQDSLNHDLFASDTAGMDDFAGIREYHTGDQPNHMAWKAIAKTGELQTKIFNAEKSKDIWIKWSSLREDLDIEKHLSILCRMILDADDNGHSYGLEIPGLKIKPASGQQHKHNCLKALALFGSKDAQ